MSATHITGALGITDVSGGVPEQTLRDFDRRSGKLTWRMRHAAKFYNELKGRGSKRAVSDYEYDHYETTEFTREGTLVGDAGTGGATPVAGALLVSTLYVAITNASNFLQIGDTIHVASQQTNQTNTTALVQGEEMHVVSVNGSVVGVQRNGGAGNTSTNATAASGSSLYWTKSGNASHHGSSRMDSKIDTVTMGRQYIQTYRYSFDFTVQMKATQMKIDEQQRIARSKLLSANRDIDTDFWTGKQRREFEDGHLKLYQGGIFSYLNRGWDATGCSTTDSTVNAWSSTYDLVTGDGTSRVYKASQQLTETMLWKFFEQAFINGNVENKVGWCGPSFPTELQILLGSKLKIEVGETKYGTKIMRWIHPALPDALPLIVERNWYKQYDRDLVILDMDNVEYNYVVWAGPSPWTGPSDLRKMTTPATDGAMAEQNEYIAELGINPMALCTHSWMTELTATSLT